MNFREQLLAELSRKNADYIASVVDHDEKLYKQIIDLILTNEKYISGRAAWVMEILWLKYPYLIKPYIDQLIDFLKISKYDNQKRHITKILSTIDLKSLDEDRLGILIDRCFTWLEDPVYPTAVKMFSMQIIANYVETEPILAQELIAILENQYNDSTPGFKNRANKLLQKLYQLID